MAREYKLKSPKIDGQKVLCTLGKWKGFKLDDVETGFWAWCWNKFLHLEPGRTEHQYIVQNYDSPNRNTDQIFSPDPSRM